jgi:hypothetical protein
MNLIDAAHTVLAEQIPVRVTLGGKHFAGGTAYFHDVPISSLMPGCEVVRTEAGWNIKGSIDDCQFTGHALPAANGSDFRRVLISFVKQPSPEPLH